MRVGFALGNIGPIGTAQNLVKIAQRAEALGYDRPLDRRTPPVARGTADSLRGDAGRLAAGRVQVRPRSAGRAHVCGRTHEDDRAGHGRAGHRRVPHLLAALGAVR
jgi:hypothetical protein